MPTKTDAVQERAETCIAGLSEIVKAMHPERFLVLPDPAEEKHGAIFLPSHATAEKYVGYVVAVGDKCNMEIGDRVAWLKGHNPSIVVGEWSVRSMAFDDILFTMKD